MVILKGKPELILKSSDVNRDRSTKILDMIVNRIQMQKVIRM
jgi:hypothetical protein